MHLSRRDFLKVSTSNAALVLAISMPTALTAKANLLSGQNNTERSRFDTWDVYLTIHADNRIEIASPVQDMGQHMKTAGPMLLAEELDADWSLVSCTVGATHLTKNTKDGKVAYRHANMDTGGSHALRNNWDYLRQAGAAANQMLKQAAAKSWRCELDDISSKKSYLYRKSTGEKLSFGAVAQIAATLSPPEKMPTLKNRKDYSIIGKDATTVDIDQIITGKPLFSLDMDYPGQLHVVVARCPYYQGKIKSYDDSKALAVNGVLSTLEIEPVVKGSQKFLSAGIAVVATSLWAALKARRLLTIEWHKGAWANESGESLHARYLELCQSESDGKIIRDEGDIKAGLKSAKKTLDLVYSTPFFHHACMEPISCIADIKSDKATLVVGHQSPESAAKTIAELAGIDVLKVEIQAHRMGGGFGRKWMGDFITEAAIISQKLESPVKVTWTREDEMEQDYFAPMQVTRIKAGLDTSNKVSAWHYRQASKRGSGFAKCFPANLVDNYRLEVFNEDCGTPVGPWRGPGHLQYTFASESMMDELAHVAKINPLDFRKTLFSGKGVFPYNEYGGKEIDAQRMWKCFEKVAQMSDWRKARPQHIGLGIAGHFTFGSYTAFVVEVDTTNAPSYRVTKCWGTIDCGLAVNPNHIRNQMEGGFIDGLNAAMYNQVDVQNGRVNTSNFDKLPMLKMAQAPLDIEVGIMQNDYPPTGVGEPPTAPAAAALANALFAASGQRLRTLPLKLEA